MITRTVTYTRPSTAVNFWQPTPEQSQIMHNYRSSHGIMDELSVTDFILTSTLTFPDQETFDAFYADSELNAIRAIRDAYNAENGIMKDAE